MSSKGVSRHRAKQRRQVEEKEHDELMQRLRDMEPPLGSLPGAVGTDVCFPADFAELPVCARTLKGLKAAGYIHMTDIQRAGIPHALVGRDVLGAAKTGSGKTLAFLVPLVEKLWKAKWGPQDGLGAIVISPTRELALQIFDTLRKVGRYHTFSAGLVIGGKDFEAEAEVIGRMNILICTPGRLLQHMDETYDFDSSRTQMLVLDEADRCLDMGFTKSLNAIVANLPKDRQTLLFSATQTKSVKDLARLSLDKPEYVFVHEDDQHATPEQLQQMYLTAPLQSKLSVLYGFLRSHKKQKIIIFVASCKESAYYYEVFRHLRPGIPLLALHGKMKQKKRMTTFYDFCARKHAALFCTDIASRGLDFPAVNWVVQLDCPDDTDTYIHRAGRTARYKYGGQALLMILPSEIKMVDRLRERKIPLKKIRVNEQKTVSLDSKIQGIVTQFADLKEMAQKCFASYARSVFLMKDKEVFDAESLPLAEFALSLGLPSAPQVRFLRSGRAKSLKNAPRRGQNAASASRDAGSEDGGVHEGTSSAPNSLEAGSKGEERGDSDSEDDLFAVRRTILPQPTEDDVAEEGDAIDDSEDPRGAKIPTARVPRKIRPGRSAGGSRIVFDEEESDREDGDASASDAASSESASPRRDAKKALPRAIQEARERIARADEEDRALQRERLRERRHKRRRLEHEARGDMLPGTASGAGGAALASESEGSSMGESESESDSENEDSPTLATEEDLALRILQGNA